MDNVNYKKEFIESDNAIIKVETFEPEYQYNKSHMFNIGIAQRFGVNEAIILENLMYWINHNKANNKNLHDGYYWTYNSIAAFHQLLPYLSEKQIRYALDKLENNGIIKTGNYNKLGFDKTKWYTIIDEGLCTFWQMGIDEVSNQFATGGEPIPLLNTDSKPIKKACKKRKKYLSNEDIKEYKYNVFIREKDYNILISKYGKEQTDKLINKLSISKEANGYKYENDYAAIQNWVIDSLKVKELQQENSIPLSAFNIPTKNDMIDELMGSK